ncbi:MULTISPECIES: glycoside hydrolase family 76 protein [unclassified Legionella]|uniref:glycoside hydrolase family 76 protein n=1 Tax=unclassified Legionella TaxID=2622702 RepID=UPI001F5FDE51|nr:MULTISPECIES: glycoside hydrolase family 76 protein [unclassified Legionella]MDI9818717.1 glycoside hydrolase family 76 protein [Legionella sp. PL877]
MMYKIVKITFLLFCYLSFQLQAATLPNTSPALPVNENQLFRDMVVDYVRTIANHVIMHSSLPESRLDSRWNRYAHADWSVQIAIYYQGNKLAQGSAHNTRLSKSIALATEAALNQTALPGISAHELEQFRFKVTFDYYPNQYYAFIEYRGKGLELSGNRVAIRRLDVPLLQQQISDSQHYLLSAMHPSIHGFSKSYDAGKDKREGKLRTIYSASSLYTLLKLYQLNHDPDVKKQLKPIADFLLSMQVKTGANAGAFYYAYDPNSEQKTCQLVVGTSSKTIFTLLELYRFYHSETYLNAAKKAGDWLLGMIKPNGEVTAIATCRDDVWEYDQKQSFLYSGQVLSALSRLYALTQDQRYHHGATLIAKRFEEEISKQGLLVGDDYRPKNTISTSWVLRSLIDYAKINKEKRYLDLIRQVAAKILSLQITNESDVYTYGRYRDTRKASGNGWLNEVMSDLYEFCQNSRLGNCQQYYKPILLSSRWLIQNSYSQANSYDVKNPSQAIGGFISFFANKTVRTDAVCHGLNSLINLLTIVGNNNTILLTVPERPFAEILPSLSAGKGFL